MDELTDFIYDILQEAPYGTYCGWYREKLGVTHTSFYGTTEVPEDFSDDDYENVSIVLSFDTWSKSEEEAKEQRKYIRRILKSNNFMLFDSNNGYETDTEIYHKTDRFVYQLENSGEEE